MLKQKNKLMYLYTNLGEFVGMVKDETATELVLTGVHMVQFNAQTGEVAILPVHAVSSVNSEATVTFSKASTVMYSTDINPDIKKAVMNSIDGVPTVIAPKKDIIV